MTRELRWSRHATGVVAASIIAAAVVVSALTPARWDLWLFIFACALASFIVMPRPFADPQQRNRRLLTHAISAATLVLVAHDIARRLF